MIQNDPKVVVALDYANARSALKFVDTVNPELCRLKVGKELFTREGPELVRQLVREGFDVFLDLKFHDIPNTVGKAVSAAAELGVWMLNVHALGGRPMLLAARQAVDAVQTQRKPLLIAVSILTSTDQLVLDELGIGKTVQQTVQDLTAMALACGIDGMVCSALEADVLRDKFGDKPVLVTPGIRPAGSDNDDQHRIMTPQKAIQAGASYLVIGRPITQSSDPAATLQRINESLMSV